MLYDNAYYSTISSTFGRNKSYIAHPDSQLNR